uniref:MoaB/Mog domain-containing protein n=1 Tax=Ignisphaera aggregans TaxID=334771 RepID=A0A7J3QE26_9CREN
MYNEALRWLFKYLEPEDIISSLLRYSSVKPRIVEVDARKSIGYRAAEDIIASNDIPLNDISHFDGYAVRGLEVCEEYNIIENVSSLDLCQATYITTGSSIPENTDAVIPIERVKVVNGKVKVYGSIRKGFGIISKGSDVKKSYLVIRHGEIINPIHIRIITELGIEYIKVYNPIKISIISTGDEFINKKKHETSSLLIEYFIRLFSLGTVNKNIVCGDDVKELIEKFKETIKESDLVIVLGGVSLGVNDYSYKALLELNPIYTFRGIKVQPGRATSGGIVDKKIVVLLPGLIQSTISGMLFIVAPVVSYLYGTHFSVPTYYTVLIKSYNCSEFSSFRRLRFVKHEGNGAEIIESTSAHAMPIIDSNGFIIIDKYIKELKAGSIIKVHTIPFLMVGKTLYNFQF